MFAVLTAEKSSDSANDPGALEPAWKTFKNALFSIIYNIWGPQRAENVAQRTKPLNKGRSIITYVTMVDSHSLDKLKRVGKIGVWAFIVMEILLIAVCGYYSSILWNCITDSKFAMSPVDNGGTTIDSVCSIMECLVGMFCMAIAYFLIKSITDGDSPFTRKNVSRLRTICLALFALYFGIIIAEYTLIAVLDPKLYHLDYPISLIAISVVTYIISLLFEYGTALQTESDEIL